MWIQKLFGDSILTCVVLERLSGAEHLEVFLGAQVLTEEVEPASHTLPLVDEVLHPEGHTPDEHRVDAALTPHSDQHALSLISSLQLTKEKEGKLE